MKDRPILFSGEMVLAILDGRKTQTRRVVKGLPLDDIGDPLDITGPEWYEPIKIDRHGDEYPGEPIFGIYGDDWGVACPYGGPGDRLWVREAFMVGPSIPGTDYSGSLSGYQLKDDDWIEYKATPPHRHPGGPWRPSIHMPRWACRIILEITAVRVERVQQIGEDDALAEGVRIPVRINQQTGERRILRDVLSPALDHPSPVICAFGSLWDSINAKRGYGWDINPWVWVVEFKVIKARADG